MRFRALIPGSTIAVQVARVPENQSDDISLTIPAQTFQVGQIVTGVVVGLTAHNPTYGYSLAFIELAPTIEGKLHWRKAPPGFLNSLHKGKPLSVRIVSRDPDGKYELSSS